MADGSAVDERYSGTTFAIQQEVRSSGVVLWLPQVLGVTVVAAHAAAGCSLPTAMHVQDHTLANTLRFFLNKR